MRLVLGISALLCLTAASPAWAQRLKISWGKPGVSYADYRRDAIECGHNAWYEDVSHTDAAGVFKKATSQLDNNEAGIGSTSELRAFEIAMASARIVDSTQPEKRMNEVRTFQHDVLGKCLSDRGYTQFRLTQDQQERLRRLRKGQPARHQYLYRLGSDRRVLDSQAI